MKRIQLICNHPIWQDAINKIKELEKERIFCGHNVSHFLDVARIAYIENLENNLKISKELIYATALLHDIGRYLEYLNGTTHEQASAVLAKTILQDCSFNPKEQDEILDAIRQHRNSSTKQQNDLAGIIYRADKKSRACLFCQVQDQCNWDKEKKNLTLNI